MACLILYLILTVHCLLPSSFGANLPTVTVTNAHKSSTIRFPTDNERSSTTERSPLLETLPTTSTEPSTIKPSKSSSDVKIIGDYSVAVQHVSQEDEIVVKATPLLELLNILRQLPHEKLLELYPKLLGEAADQGTTTTTESVLEFLNHIREQPNPTSTQSTTLVNSTPKVTTIVPTENTFSSNVLEADLSISSSIATTKPVDTTSPSTNITKDVLEEVEDASSFSTEPSLSTVKNTSPSTTSTTTEKATTSTRTSSISYEFTDYPPPLPPSLSEFPHTIKRHEGRNGDASFAIGVAVGIFACVIVASTGVTWCVCRRHWGRRNVYATMERTEEMPRAFTKPGPPVILPREFESSKRLSSSTRILEHQDQECNRVTEL